jgi:hypothetical protein
MILIGNGNTLFYLHFKFEFAAVTLLLLVNLVPQIKSLNERCEILHLRAACHLIIYAFEVDARLNNI